MSQSRDAFDVVHGVDFSGGERPEGKIWIATRDDADDAQPIRLRRGFDHRALVDTIAASGTDGRRHLWRIDAPFGVALETADAHGLPHDWRAIAEWMSECGSPRAWRTACRSLSRREPKRTADRVAHTPMAPGNLRIFKQTWSAIVRVLLPLVERGVRIEPLAGPEGASVTVIESCPASILRERGWPVRGYKGTGDPPRRVRTDLLERLRTYGINIPSPLARLAIDDTEGDGLDALLMLLPCTLGPVPDEARVEGWVW